MQPLSSEITGALAAVERRQKSAGQRPGTTGSSQSLTESDEKTRNWLLQRAPEATDEALAHLLTSTLGVTVTLRTELRFPVEGGYYNTPIGYSVRAETAENLPLALTKVERAMMPPTKEQAEGFLVMLQAATAHRAGSDATNAVAYSIYSGELTRWPADVAKTVCENMARGVGRPEGTNWFPTLAEISKECERLSERRRMMLRALERSQ